jgi:uncharacterized protein YdaU (DUF1376 family)
LKTQERAGKKLLAEWFWIDRWDGSSAALLPMEARGLYREMLTAAWRRGGSLPNDHEAIQRAIRCTAGEWARSWQKIAPYWRVDDDRLVNDTQLEIYAEATERQERAHAKAMKAAAASPQVIARARAQAQSQGLAQGRARAEPEVSPPSPSPSPSLTPSPENGQSGPSPKPAEKPNADERIALGKGVWAAFQERAGIERDATSGEWHLILRWLDAKIPLRVLERGISETGGTPRNLWACEKPVTRAIDYWQKATA